MMKNFVTWRTGKLLFNSSAISQVSTLRGLSNPFKPNTNVAPNETNPELEPANRKPGNAFGQVILTTLPDNTKVETQAERDKRLKVLKLEVDIYNQEGRRVPSLDFLQEHHWAHVLTLPSKSARIKYYAFLWQIQMKKLSEKEKKIQRAAATEQRIADLRKEREENTHIIYGLAHTSMFLRIYDTTINHWQNNRLTRAMQFAPKMVLDCSYDAYMNDRESSNAAKQLMLCFAENRAHDEPFDLHFCNTNFESLCMQHLNRYIPTMLNPEFPMNVHSKCFTKLFPKEQLVYLTPHCREDLKKYNPDDIYIVGAMVDTVNNEPLSLAKAKRMGLRMARLPLDRYLQWGSGSGKSLTLNQMIKIMLDIRKTGDWNTALQHVPKRKIIDQSLQQANNRQAFNKRANKLNVRIDHLLKYEDNRRGHQGLRQRKEGMDFNLDKWATGKKNTSRNSS